MKPTLLDSNIIIYGHKSDGGVAAAFVATRDVACSAISRVEAIGFFGIDPRELRALTAFFSVVRTFAVDDVVIDRAADLRRQRKKMKLGDAVIGATALVHGLELATRNVSDFAWIGGLSVIDPYASA